jgi:hypothetical protein
MGMLRTPMLISIALAAALAGCATSPSVAPQPSEGCTLLARVHAAAENERRTARSRQEEVWKHTPPGQLAASYLHEKHAAQRAEVRKEKLRVEMDAHACALLDRG